MIADLRDYPDGAAIDTELCIIGAGAAGITLASEFAASTRDVLVLESGGRTLEADTQALYDVENVGLPVDPMIRSRLRVLGGTTNHWDGRCTPLDAIDFERRSWVPHSGWPITRSQLDPYYARAQGVCDLGDAIYDDRVLAQFEIPDPGLDPSKLRAHYWMLSPPTRFGQKYEQALAESKNVKLLLHANVVNLQTNAAASHLDHVDVKTLEGKQARVRAKQVVLCCGGIENARLLLLSNRVDPAGLGNGRDLVGRFFQEHVRSWQQAVPTRTPFSLMKIYNFYASDAVRYHVGLSVSDELQAKEQLLNCSAMTFFEGLGYSSSGSAMRLVRALTQRELPPHPGDDVYSVLSDFDEIVMNVRARFLLSGTQWHSELSTTLVVDSEQAPNPESRIRLSDQRDALGLRRSQVDWRLSALDRRSSLEMFQLIGAEWGRLNQARVRVPDWLSDGREDWAHNVRDIGHHIGTTRMADDPRSGVVDRDCKVHGVDNLYVAGASVFATSGHANPTLTIVALALRLAEHLAAHPA